MVSTACYLLGPPGAGKSTLMAEVLGRLATGAQPAEQDTPVPHVAYPPTPWVQPGRLRPGFPGTDTLPFNVLPRALAWIAGEHAPAAFVGEGDRLACSAFLGALRDRYEHLEVVALDVPPGLAWDRVQTRARALGVRPPSLSWWRGRVTKTARLADKWATLRLGPMDVHLAAAVVAGRLA